MLMHFLKPQEKGYLKTGHINEDYLPKNGGGLGKDSGVFLCMLMYKMVHKKTLTVKGGWVTRLMRFRWKEITKNRRPEQLFPWTIMPPQFYDILCETPNHGALPFCIGMKEEYPALWDVDTVYIPIVIEDIHWLLLRVDMRTLEIDVIPKIKILGTEVWPQYNGPVGSNSGVFVCMLMRNLVLDLPNQIEGNLQDTCMKYRRFMADEFYAARA
ncbi:hypothetical protein E3N88_07343 [Mikania micrantha]|uniref:Ubiquitin-like protease family profile domain-containing protein n=1 Tax=Mikania micrantha TaxID=192012 RepID=A0A5N6PTE0_9ASTR|nr:hypothetical protein E3N88_07343 [Mikania micrantha]